MCTEDAGTRAKGPYPIVVATKVAIVDDDQPPWSPAPKWAAVSPRARHARPFKRIPQNWAQSLVESNDRGGRHEWGGGVMTAEEGWAWG